MDLQQTKRQKKLRYHKSWYTGVLIIIRKALYEYEEENIKPVFGTVEIDETYVGLKFKNRRKKNRECKL